MDLAPQAHVSAAPPSPEAPSPASVSGLEHAVALLAERATPFARMPPREKAALLRACLPRILAIAPEMVALTCRAAGVDSASPLAGTAWLAGPVALLAAVRRFAEALEDVAANGRPTLSSDDLRDRLDGRVVARLAPRSFAERALVRDAETVAVFEEGVEPEDVISAQAAFYRQMEPTGGVARVPAAGGPPSAAPLLALSALFVEGKVALLETSAAQAWLGPLVESALAPLVVAGFLQVVQGGDGGVDTAHPAPVATPPGGGGPVIVVPAFYARDELWFVARRLVSEISAGAAFGVSAPRAILVAGCWAQRELFVEQLQRAASASPRGAATWTLVCDPDPGADLPSGAVGVFAAGCDEPVEMLAAAVDRCDARWGTSAAEIVVHPVQEEDPETAAALGRATVRLRCDRVGINQWPARISFRGEAPGGAWMLARVDKAVVRGPLRLARPPGYFYDNLGAPRLGARLAAFQAAPSLGALLGGVRE